MQEQVPKGYGKKFDLPNMTRQEMLDLLREQNVCRVSFNDETYPYTLPMEYYFSGDVMYLHFTNTGKKIDLLRKDPNVTVEVDWASGDLTNYRSVIIKGKLVGVENDVERNFINVEMETAIKDKRGIKDLLGIPWEKKGIDYLGASNIPMILLKLDIKEMTGKKAF
ncbi:flavin-nucleotide-binding protein [Methanocella sp. CWC-04]|uniref:Flavin-nucleotide-binding protein n=1 Tax=Methanooceanicella nereidis TaxID=2052831 RepID=A0AAP2REC3_9EURY|nr:pyridoxamine 5'-phosphate oxidase family protein [Methanocella sp. CWC-04]MCD1295236.1 flavin-nucleotide-binding protein [Methanocella sp. CWC-04]